MVANARAPSSLWKQPLIFLAMDSARSDSLLSLFRYRNNCSVGIVREGDVQVGGESGGLCSELSQCGGKVVAVTFDGVTLKPDRLRVSGKAGGSDRVVSGEVGRKCSAEQVALALGLCISCGTVHLGEHCRHVVGPALVPSDPDGGQIPEQVTAGDRMGGLVVLAVHGHAVMDHDATERSEHACFVRGGLTPGRTGEQ